MEICCWIKPQINPLLSIIKTISKNIGLQSVWLSLYISKEFEVHLVSIRLIRSKLQFSTIFMYNTTFAIQKQTWKLQVLITYIIGHYSACRVARYQSDLHINLPK